MRRREPNPAKEQAIAALARAADALVNADGDPVALAGALDLVERGRKDAEKAGALELAAEFALLEAAAHNDLGAPADALRALEGADLLREDPDYLRERSAALFELCRFDDAAIACKQALVPDRCAEGATSAGPGFSGLTISDDLAWPHYYLGLIAERSGAWREAEDAFERATRLAPQDFPPAVTCDADTFDALVEAALTELPRQIRNYLANVAVAVEDVPSLDDLDESDPPLSPSILGIFRGSPLGEKASMDPWSHFPSSIVLYQKNLQRFARDRDELVEQIRITLIHEVGHFLGFDEEDLWERGLD